MLRETPLGMGALRLNSSSGRTETTTFDKVSIYFISLESMLLCVLFMRFIPLHIRIDQRLLDAGYGIGQYLVHLLQSEIEELTGQL